MVETLTGTSRSNGLSCDRLFDMDTPRVPDRGREDAPLEPEATRR
jgi:hypothetical protein